jgi:hypothetical protein
MNEETNNPNIVSYERLLRVANHRKTPGERCYCECGKEIFKNQLEKHRQTSLHNTLMFRKQKILKGIVEDQEVQ